MDRLTKDAVNMLSIMDATANSKDSTKQYIYWIAVAVYHLILKAYKTKWQQRNFSDNTKN